MHYQCTSSELTESSKERRRCCAVCAINKVQIRTACLVAHEHDVAGELM